MSNVTTERTPSKRSNIKTQFQIRDASDVSSNPVTPVRIAPPPVTVKRSKSLKSERCNTLKRHQAASGTTSSSPTPVTVTATIVTATTTTSTTTTSTTTTTTVTATSTTSTTTSTSSTQDGVQRDVNKVLNKPITRQYTEPALPSNNSSNANTSSNNSNNANTSSDKYEKLPEQASWQAVVNTHRRGSSMTFETTQNWAQFDQANSIIRASSHLTPSGPLSAVANIPDLPPTTPYDWSISSKQWTLYENTFHKVKPLHGFLSGKQVREFLLKSNLSNEELSDIWDLSDMDHDGSLSLVEFAVAMHSIAALKSGETIPKSVPSKLTESLIRHIHNKNLMLSSLNKDEDSKKSPEKSSLKSGISRGASVSFKEDTLIRSRPRPVRRAAPPTLASSPGGCARVELQLHYCHSSSSYYSSDYDETSESDNSSNTDNNVRRMGSSDKKRRRDKKSKKEEHAGTSSDKQEEGETESVKRAVRRERTYDDPDEILKRLNATEEDVEALIQHSDDEAAPPTRPPPPRTKSVRTIPASPPPDLPLTTTSPTTPPPSCSPPSCQPPSNSPPSCVPPSGNSSDITSSGGVVSSDGTPHDTDEPSTAKPSQGYERLPEETQDHREGLIPEEEGGEVIDSDDDFYNAGDGFKRTQNRIRTGSMDISNLLDRSGYICPEDPKHHYESTEPDDICVIKTEIDIDELKAEVDELKAEFPSDLLTLNDLDIDYEKVPASETNIDELRQKDLHELRSQLRNVEIHNNALISVTRELKIELIKAKEQKLHLHNMLQYLKED